MNTTKPKEGKPKVRAAARRNPCFTCAAPDCETCMNNPENSTPIRLYTPKGAARAMLAGMILRDMQENKYSWDSEISGFRCDPKDGGQTRPVANFSGLFIDMV